MSAPLVSVIIPVYNGAAFLAQTLSSVDQQTYRPLEVIVVDDGSTDGSAEIARTHPVAPMVIVQRNQGVSFARNAGVAASHGEFVAFLDQDDWWRPAKIERQVALLDDAEVGLVHTNVSHFDDGTQSYGARLNPVWASAELVGRTFDRLVLGNGIYNSSVMVRRRLLDEVGAFNAAMPGNTVQDYDLWLRLARRCSFAYANEELTVFRLHPAQGTWKRRAMLTDELDVLARVVGIDQMMAIPARRLRIARLLEELGRHQLAAGEAAIARETFRRLFRARPNLRSAVFLAIATLPASAGRRLAGHDHPDRVSAKPSGR